jgi:hypothetical protein
LYYYITPEIGGQRLKLRMPAAFGAPLGAVPEAIMQDLYTHDPVGFTELFHTFMNEYFPPFIPAMVQPAAEVITNKSFLTGKPLTPASVAGGLGELQYTPNTSPPAKALARLLGPPLRSLGTDVMSPIAMDHLVEGYTGSAGQIALQAVGAASGRPGPPTDWAQLPVVRGLFLRRPGLSAQPIEDYYTEKASFDAGAASKSIIKRDMKNGDQSAMGMAPEAWVYAQADQRLRGVSQALSIQRSLIWGIYENKQMNDDEKRQHVEAIVEASIKLAQSATAEMRQFKQMKIPAGAQPAQPAEPEQ